MAGEPVPFDRRGAVPAVPANDHTLPAVAALAAPAPSLRRWRPSLRLLSFAAIVLVPTLAAALYYALVAAPQYVVEFRFGLRMAAARPEPPGPPAGAAAASETGFDSYALVQYVTSRSVIDDLGNSLDLRAMFARPEADWPARLAPNAPIERVVAYWKGQVDAFFDPLNGTVTVTVRAFTPDDALALAAAIEKACEHLVNGLSERARRDALGHSEEDVAEAGRRLAAALQKLQAFRDRHGVVDPQSAASARLELAGRLRGEIAGAEAQLSVLRHYLRPEAPPLKLLTQRIRGLENQERAIEAEVTPAPASAAPALSQIMAGYEALEAEKGFAESAYKLALEARDRARAMADRQHVYLAPFVRPSRPEEALYPRPLRSTGIVLLLAFAVWAIGGLAVHSVRDHL